MENRHLPVFKNLPLNELNLQPGQIFYDLTLGDGGHTQVALEAGARVVSVDVDQHSIERALSFINPKIAPVIVTKTALDRYRPDFKWLIVNCNYSEFPEIAKQLRLPQADAIMADLGTSQYHMLEASRGFSFQSEGPLDMRLDQSLGVTARDFVSALAETELIRLFEIGDEEEARAVARAIVRRRQEKPFETTLELAETIAHAKRHHVPGINPATKVFMALRMAVNLERDNLKTLISALPSLTKSGTKIAFISFHSGEDRIVKHLMRSDELKNHFSVINDKPIEPTKNETLLNPKIRSAKLRLYQAK